MPKRSKYEDEEEMSEEMEEDLVDSDDDLAGLEDEDDDEEQQETERGPLGNRPAKRAAIYNVDALHEKLEDISWTEGIPWDETLAITNDDETQVENVDDDLARELAFYKQALSAAQDAIQRFESAGVPWLRPTDYYAEMVKSDEHMNKVKKQLMHEQQQIEQAEERRKAREAKQYSKQVQAEKLKERQQSKKQQIESISKLRKQRERSGFDGDMDYDSAINKMGKKSSTKNLGERFNPKDLPQRNKKRQQRDSKYGFGGRKTLSKQNDATSAADMSGYKPGRFDDGPKGRGGKGGKGGKPHNNALKPNKNLKKQNTRPGKARRNNMKGKGRK